MAVDVRRFPSKSIFILVFCALIFQFVLLLNPIRSWVKSFVPTPDRKVVAQIDGKLQDSQPMVRFLKIETSDGILLEVYDITSPLEPVLLTHLNLFGFRDGLFEYRDQTTNFALADLDGDNEVELIAPAFDEKMMPRLLVYKFNFDTRQLVPLAKTKQ